MSRRRARSGNNFVFPSEFDWLLFSTGTTTRRAAKLLGRTTRTVRDWRSGRRPVPRWAFQLVYYAALDVPELQLERARFRGWVDLRRWFPEPANADQFLQAQEPSPAAAQVPGHAVPNPAQPGRPVVPAGGHGRAGG